MYMCPDYLVYFLTFLSLFHKYNIIIIIQSFLFVVFFFNYISYFCTIEVAAINSAGSGNYSKAETVYMS